MRSWSKKRPERVRINNVPTRVLRENDRLVCVKFIVDPDTGELKATSSTERPFTGIVSDKDQHERAVITGLFFKFLQNDFEAPGVEITFHDVFEAGDQSRKFDEKGLESGTYKVCCPPGFNGPIPEDKQLIYKPTVELSKIRRFAGMNTALYKPNVTILDEAAVPPATVAMTDDDDDDDNNNNNEKVIDTKFVNFFAENHPIDQFWLEAKDEMDFKKSDRLARYDIEENQVYYTYSNECMDKIHTFFDMAIFPRIHYTRFEKTIVECNLGRQEYDPVEQPSLVAVFQISYLVVNTNV